jgi:hypothetical protein
VVTDAEPPAGLDQAYRGRRLALVVGIDRYADPALGDLRFAAKDRLDLVDPLSKKPEPSDIQDADAVLVLPGDLSWRVILSLCGHRLAVGLPDDQPPQVRVYDLSNLDSFLSDQPLATVTGNQDEGLGTSLAWIDDPVWGDWPVLAIGEPGFGEKGRVVLLSVP